MTGHAVNIVIIQKQGGALKAITAKSRTVIAEQLTGGKAIGGSTVVQGIISWKRECLRRERCYDYVNNERNPCIAWVKVYIGQKSFDDEGYNISKINSCQPEMVRSVSTLIRSSPVLW